MAWSGWWHNQVGLLTEVASARIATPIVQQKADPTKPARPAAADRESFEAERRQMMEHPDAPLPAPRDTTPRTEYPRPWLGGTWKLRDILDYELTPTFAFLETAADRPENAVHQNYEQNSATLDHGTEGKN